VLIAGGEYLIVLPPGYNVPPAWVLLTNITYPKDLTLFIIWVISVAGLAIIVTPWKTVVKKWALPLLLTLICAPAAIIIWNIELMTALQKRLGNNRPNYTLLKWRKV
jgi:hypothetical protein